MPPGDLRLGDVLGEARRRLAVEPFGSPREAALLLGRVLGLSEAQVMARDEMPVPAAAAARFAALVERRRHGEPVAYLTGEREFYGRPFTVDRRVLIPRPETEHVIETVLALALPAAPRILDVGTGSGCLAVTLALELPAARVVASDLSPAALALAAGNARRHQVAARVHMAASDLTAALALERFDLVVSNPPYVDPEDAPRLSPEVVAFEPGLALFAPDHGQAVMARLFAAAAALRPGIYLAVEIGGGQLDSCQRMAAAAGLTIHQVRRDYAGLPRVLVLSHPG